VWWDGVSGCWLLISSYASHPGLTLAPDEPRPAATAILRIEALAAEFSQNRLARDASAKQKTRHVRLSCRTACPARTERKPTAEFVDHGVVRAGNPIGRQRNLARPFTVDPACAQFTFVPGRPFKRAKLSLGQQQRIQAQRAKAIPYSAHR